MKLLKSYTVIETIRHYYFNNVILPNADLAT